MKKQIAILNINGELKTLAGEPETLVMVTNTVAIVDTAAQVEVFKAGYVAGKKSCENIATDK